MKNILFVIILFLSANVYAEALCSKFKESVGDIALIEGLAYRLGYSYQELCQNNRILDIQKEERMIRPLNLKDVITVWVVSLHYAEYSCEYYYEKESESWLSDKSRCYNTW